MVLLFNSCNNYIIYNKMEKLPPDYCYCIMRTLKPTTQRRKYQSQSTDYRADFDSDILSQIFRVISHREVAAQWPVMRDTLFYGQHYHGGGALEHAVPVAVPYPVAVPAPPPHPQVALAAPAVSAASSAATLQAAAYHSMQLVPCLCSVPKDDIDNAGSVLVQGNQQLNENK
ncbi:hypothetical protein ANN_20157 [Periplaneta americana]|uniref:Uncharacterized protein n=1 Tax=Periplaneta americana TaxID=6978 RepID=A0ABQ8SCA1_PERAM|nr:hypothetical protein ANN_20157 [Periplaneta americana]